MSNTFSAEFATKFQKVLDSPGKANEGFQGAMTMLREHGYAYPLQNVHPSLFMTHTENRGGLMLSPFNCHRNAAKVHSVGADRKQLSNAVAVELISLPTKG